MLILSLYLYFIMYAVCQRPFVISHLSKEELINELSVREVIPEPESSKSQLEQQLTSVINRPLVPACHNMDIVTVEPDLCTELLSYNKEEFTDLKQDDYAISQDGLRIKHEDQNESFEAITVKEEWDSETAAHENEEDVDSKPRWTGMQSCIDVEDSTAKCDRKQHCEGQEEQTDNRVWKCDVCNKSFERNSYLQRHLYSHKGEKPWKCDICNKCFVWKQALQVHTRSHTGDKPWECDMCGECFVRKRDLEAHILKHSGKKPWKCDTCGRGFIHRSHLQRHVLIHSGEKPWKCDICDKRFIHPTELRKHSLIHSGNKPWKCDVCGKGFLQRANLQRHSFTHTGEKPHICTVCNKAFIQHSHLRRHQRVHWKPVEMDGYTLWKQT